MEKVKTNQIYCIRGTSKNRERDSEGKRKEVGIEKNKGGARWAGRFWKESEKKFVKNSCHNEWGDTRIFRKFCCVQRIPEAARFEPNQSPSVYTDLS